MRDFEFNGVVRLTKIGTAYLVFTLVIGFAALNTGNNALYIGLTFLLGSLLLSGIASKGGLKHLSVELRGIDEAWAGRQVHAVLRVSNRSRIWNVRDVVITSDELSEPAVIPIVMRRSSVDVAASFLFSKRGLAQLKRVDLYTRYPFGFFLKKRRVKMTGEVIVYPRLLSREEESERFRAIVGEEFEVNRPGFGTEVHSFRDYVRGDSLRQVHWKKSASGGRWIVRQTAHDVSRAVHVVVDPFKPRQTTDEQFEAMISAATTFIYHALGRGSNVLVSLPRVELHGGEAHSPSPIFRALALVEATHEPLWNGGDRDTVIFSLRRSDERASA